MQFSDNLSLDEPRRREAVVRALGDGWNPVTVHEGEEYVGDLLYRGLHDDQQPIYDELVGAGVLGERSAGRVAD